MRIIIQAFAIFAFVLSIWSTASAETLDAKANTVTPVGFFYFHTSRGYNCLSGGKGKVRINQPEHGTLKTEWRTMPMGSKRGCKGVPAQGLAVWYIPHKGYRGKDKFSFVVNVPGPAPGAAYSGSKHYSYKVNVD